jgi:predicted acetyltransferase
MSFDVVTVGADDFPAALEPVHAAFGDGPLTEQQLSDRRLMFDDYRGLGARDESGAWCAMVADFQFDLTVSGAASVPVSGVTMVGVAPTHRRQGIASTLMGRLLDRAADEGKAAAILLAEEAVIYGRFGFGVATEISETRIHTPRSGFAVPVPDGGRLELVDPIEGTRLAEAVWETHRRSQPGATERHEWTWEQLRRDRVDERDGAGSRFWVIHRDATDRPDGFASYRIKSAKERGLPRWTAMVDQMVALSPEVDAILFRFLCDIDLVEHVEFRFRPVQDPLQHRLVDPRQLQVTARTDWLWARVLDVAAAFSARTYGTADSLVIQVDDAFRPDLGGRFAFEGDRSGGSCQRTDASPDLRLGSRELGSLLLGTLRPSVLADAGRVNADPDVLARADAFFASLVAPFACTEF